MIGSIRGKVILKDGNHLLIEVSGVGYRVLVSSKVISSINLDSEIFVYTYTFVREDALELFGFPEIGDLKLFENLISVSGVGPKTAMAVFSILTRQEVVAAVIKADTNAFSAVPRLGKKNAQKIIIELKNKLGDDGSFDLDLGENSENDDVFTALKTFGFSHKEIAEALKNIDKNTESTDEKIKLSLKYLGK